MLTLDILICTVNTRIVRMTDLLMPPQERVHYVVSFQYTKDDYLKLVPQSLIDRPDVTFVKLRGEGLSANRNNALKYAQSDLVYLIDDDTRFLPTTTATIFDVFENHPNVDIALFKTKTYTGRDLRQYSNIQHQCVTFKDLLPVLTIEMVCRREKVQGILFFDPRFGLGSHYLPCYEEQIWLENARRHGLTIYYFPKEIIQTSAIFLSRLIFVDPKVQRSFGALLYNVYGTLAYEKAFQFAFISFRKKMAHFVPLFNHILQGIVYIKNTSKHHKK